ncbi:hypothetical protein AbraIFM66951_011007 [Aspergillus brasiliensis]|uniref:Uncharacterized protein n=1 Tax=Aspergillus brasiliensis TaxID=319629 RepID=A0A9W5YLT4_9EURO|nr:hypothetical protein AbraCBS73388_003868 [Aspergillus brasiliensis]GKZ41726.1 hypothetical protein AbraIFM66951_011007 [Aspergillus brasiliensis]
MTWFTSSRDTSDEGWHFDAVSLLAVIGESIIERQKHIITASPLSAFPRLLPAPQAILNMNPLTQLPPFNNVIVIDAVSGEQFFQLNYFGGIMHEIDKVEPYEFRAYEVCRSKDHSDDNEDSGLDSFNRAPRRVIGLKRFCPMNMLTLASVLLTIGLAIWSILIHDGIGLLAIITMSLSGSLSCLSQKSYPELMTRPTSSPTAESHIVMKTRSGAFIVVHCSEQIAWEAYKNQESYAYAFEPNSVLYKVMMGASTILLMVSVLLFSNCGWTMQTAIAVTYIVLNMCYWAVPILFDARRSWDTSAHYSVKRLGRAYGPESSYTAALWRAIRETGQVEWVRKAYFVSGTDPGEAWLKEANNNIMDENWDPERARDRLMAAAYSLAADQSLITTTTPTKGAS